MSHTTSPNPSGSVLGMFGRMRSDISAYRARRARYNAVFAELSALSDRELADLNISRADISYIASTTD